MSKPAQVLTLYVIRRGKDEYVCSVNGTYGITRAVERATLFDKTKSGMEELLDNPPNTELGKCLRFFKSESLNFDLPEWMPVQVLLVEMAT